MAKTKNILSKNGMLIIVLVFTAIFELSMQLLGKGSLISPPNISNLINQNGYIIILAVGMLLCILTGGNIDLAVGSIVLLVSAVAGILMVQWHWNIYLAIAACLLMGTLIGAWQAFWIAYVNIPPFVTTLAGMLVFKGIGMLLLGSRGINGFPEPFLNIFNGYMGAGVSPEFTMAVSLIVGALACAVIVLVSVFMWMRKTKKGYAVENVAFLIVKLAIICVVLMFVSSRLGAEKGIGYALLVVVIVVLAYTYFTQNVTYGRYLYALGGNAKAARLSGINTKRMMFFAYTNMGFLAGLTALVCVGRFGQASTGAGDGYELDAIGACFIGGASAYGGVGTVGGAVIGALFMGVLSIGMGSLGWPQHYQDITRGLVILGSVAFDVISKSSRKQAA